MSCLRIYNPSPPGQFTTRAKLTQPKPPSCAPGHNQANRSCVGLMGCATKPAGRLHTLPSPRSEKAAGERLKHPQCAPKLCKHMVCENTRASTKALALFSHTVTPSLFITDIVTGSPKAVSVRNKLLSPHSRGFTPPRDPHLRQQKWAHKTSHWFFYISFFHCHVSSARHTCISTSGLPLSRQWVFYPASYLQVITATISPLKCTDFTSSYVNKCHHSFSFVLFWKYKLTKHFWSVRDALNVTNTRI